jgi:N-acetyl-alpha-D-glucosaminyl L-malate synthase BshA
MGEIARMRLGMVCYASHGGSGIVATELGAGLAARGHEVHFITNDVPVRLNRFLKNIFFHRVEIDDYPLFTHTPYALNLAAKVVDVSESEDLELIHSHYAVPHATCAYLAKEMRRPAKLKTVTTLHGTDITLVGVKPSYYSVTRFSIEKSDSVSAVSEWLRRRTYESFPVTKEIAVIHNFVDSQRYRPLNSGRRSEFAAENEFLVLHASNFRAVKNVSAVVRVFALLRKRFPAKLLLVGDGPELGRAEELARELGVADSTLSLGAQECVEEIYPLADVLLLPSEHESFGLVALEAMSSGVAVVATNQGGTREVIRQGENGFLHDPKDVEGMAETIAGLFEAPSRLTRIKERARRTAVEEFPVELAIDRYLALYERTPS